MLDDQTQVKQFERGVRMGARIHGQLHPSWNHTCFPLHPDICYFTILTMTKGISKVLLDIDETVVCSTWVRPGRFQGETGLTMGLRRSIRTVRDCSGMFQTENKYGVFTKTQRCERVWQAQEQELVWGSFSVGQSGGEVGNIRLGMFGGPNIEELYRTPHMEFTLEAYES